MPNFFAILLLIACVVYVNAHGYMSNPAPRGQYLSTKLQQHEEYEPVGTDPNSNKFVCRTDTPMPVQNYLTLTAGLSVNIDLFWNAKHPGGCSVYLTHDGDKPYSEMRWYKIWQTVACDSRTTWSVPIPDYLPEASHAIFRWEWYALHVMNQGNGAVEYYVQCVDATIRGRAGGQLPQPQVQIPGHLPVIRPGNYWDPYNNDGPQTEFVTGPPVATENGTPSIATTAAGTTNAATSASSTTRTSASTSASTSARTTTASTSTSTSASTSVASTSASPTTSSPTGTTPSPCAAGTLKCICATGNKCNQGLTCVSGVCVSTDEINRIKSPASTTVLFVSVSVVCILFGLL